MGSKKIDYRSKFKNSTNIDDKPKNTSVGLGVLGAEERKRLIENTINKVDDNKTEELKTAIPSIINEDNNNDVSSIIKTLNLEYELKKVAIKDLKPAPPEWNFFAAPDNEKIIMLAESIYANGLLQPIVVREIDKNGTLQILAGHTRVKVYSILFEITQDDKYLEIEAMVFKYGILNDSQAEDIVCDTNFLQRGNLAAKDRAKCILLKTKKLKGSGQYYKDIASEIAKFYNIKRTTVFVWKKLADLIPEMEALVDKRNISIKNAYKLASLSPKCQKELYENCVHLLDNDSIKRIDVKENIQTIIDTVIDSYGVKVKSYRYEVLSNRLKDPKDEPILLFIDKEKAEKVMNELNKIDGCYIVENFKI